MMPPPFPGRPALSSLRRRSTRAEVLAAWRGLDLGPLEFARKSTSRTSGELMPNLLHRLGLEQRQAEAEILRVWNHSIDPAIVAHARPTGLRKGTLFVSVDSSVWLSEIVRYRSKEILERLQNSFGRDLIARISFRPG